MGTTVAGVLAGETPYMPHIHKRNEIGVIISYALISLKTCIPNGTANLLFWHTHLIPYSMQVNSKGIDETEQMRRLAWAFAIHLNDKYQHLHSWNKYCCNFAKMV